MRFPLRLPAAVLAGLLAAGAASAAGGEYLPVDDPLNAELRVLETMSPDARTGQWPRSQRTPHLATRPVRLLETLTPAARTDDPLDPVRRIATLRLIRGVARDVFPRPSGASPSTPRLFERRDPERGFFELSTGLEGRGEAADHARPRFASGTGLHVRATAGVDGWVLHTHTVVGQFTGARHYADPIVPNTDLITTTEDSYLAYGADHWDVRLGRSRWAWGPGEEGSLQLSATMPAITGLALGADLPLLHAHLATLSATLQASAGEQLAAHRLEWLPTDALRIGLTESARYHAGGWQPLYAIGLIPYTLVQRLLVQDEPDSAGALRNNVMVGGDLSWRVADGTRLYGELLIDDLHARSGTIPNKLGFQLGLDGAGAIGRSRVTWNGELTRLTRFVYTSFFGQSFVADGEPLGYLTGPDARRARVRLAWDPGVDWQLWARAARTDKGANTLDEPFDPTGGQPPGRTFDFEAPLGRTRDLDLGLRWWPAGGVDLGLSVGWTWVDVAVPGGPRDGARGALDVRLTR